LTRLNITSDRKQRLDLFIEPHLNIKGVRTATSLITSGHVFVEGRRVRKTQYVLQADQRVIVHDTDPSLPPKIELLYEDEYFIVLNKASGDHVNLTETSPKLSLIEKVNERWSDAQIVHRLDRDTTGVLVFGRGKHIGRALSACFEKREINKTYLALCEGVRFSPQTLDGHIAKDPRRPRSYRVHPSGKESRTEVSCVDSRDEMTAVKAEPHTGRTHQIRVHLSDAGYPILGDRLYGGPSAIRLEGDIVQIPRIMLHAAQLSIPTRSKPWEGRTNAGFLHFSAEFPDDFDVFRERGLVLDALFA